MKSVLALCVISAVSATAVASSPPTFRFSGEIQSDQLTSEAFIQPVEAGHVRFLDLPSGLRLELSAPRDDGIDDVTIVRLLREDGGTYKVLHEARTTAPADSERSFTYRVCGSEVTFLTPAPYETPKCEP